MKAVFVFVPAGVGEAGNELVFSLLWMQPSLRSDSTTSAFQRYIYICTHGGPEQTPAHSKGCVSLFSSSGVSL